MNGNEYMIAAYAVGLSLLWGYAIALWRASSPSSPSPGTPGEGRGGGPSNPPRGATP
jgi:hypothetical protein